MISMKPPTRKSLVTPGAPTEHAALTEPGQCIWQAKVHGARRMQQRKTTKAHHHAKYCNEWRNLDQRNQSASECADNRTQREHDSHG